MEQEKKLSNCYFQNYNLIQETFKASDSIQNNRSLENILTHLTTEVGELAQEIQIESGDSYKEAGVDGVVGEAVDVILCALDIIRVNNNNLTEEELLEMFSVKIAKWKSLS